MGLDQVAAPSGRVVANTRISTHAHYRAGYECPFTSPNSREPYPRPDSTCAQVAPPLQMFEVACLQETRKESEEVKTGRK